MYRLSGWALQDIYLLLESFTWTDNLSLHDRGLTMKNMQILTLRQLRALLSDDGTDDSAAAYAEIKRRECATAASETVSDTAMERAVSDAMEGRP